MQTFMPYTDFNLSALVLDNKRLGKQRVEAFQIYNILKGNTYSKAWVNHPAVLMWKGYENALIKYCLIIIEEWRYRGYKDTMLDNVIKHYSSKIKYPKWIYDHRFFYSHRKALLFKDYTHYSKYWDYEPEINYFWPTKEGY